MEWNASLYDERHAFVFQYGEDLLSVLRPQPGERILDVGCGTGHLTKAVADSGARVIGLDQSSAMIATARDAYPELEFMVADASDFFLLEPVDAVFSNAALHWVKKAEDAVICIVRALKQGGRFVAELGGRGNVATIVAALREALSALGQPEGTNPWYFPSLAEYALLLEKHGLVVTSAALFERPTPLEGEDGMRTWLRMFADSLVAGLVPTMREQVFEETEARLRGALYKSGAWVADYRRLRITAYREN
jgi:trans-aconitate methyltransferase